MRNSLLALVMLTACGRRLNVSVDYATTSLLRSMREDLDVAGHPELIALDTQGVKIRTSTAAVAEEALRVNAPRVGYFSRRANEIVLVSATENYTLNGSIVGVPENQRKLILAHELGHALGLQHTETGLMRPVLFLECIGHEATCLIEALNLEEK